MSEGEGGYIQDVHWVTYLGAYLWGGFNTGVNY